MSKLHYALHVLQIEALFESLLYTEIVITLLIPMLITM